MIRDQGSLQDRALRRHAAEMLNVSADAQEGEIRAAFLQRLRDDEFLPPPWLGHARELLRDGAISENPRDPDAPADRRAESATMFLQECEERLRSEVEKFAGEFFELTVAERVRRFADLQTRTASYARLEARLRVLASGLKVERGEWTTRDQEVAKLAQYCCELHVLKPWPRAARRQEMITEMHGAPALWQAAARSLQKDLPAVAELAPDLIGPLSELKKSLGRVAKNRRRRPRKVVIQSGGWKNWWVGLVAVMVISALLRCNESDKRRRSSEPDRSDPRYSIPTIDPEKVKIGSDVFNKFSKELQQRKAREGQPVQGTDRRSPNWTIPSAQPMLSPGDPLQISPPSFPAPLPGDLPMGLTPPPGDLPIGPTPPPGDSPRPAPPPSD